MKPLSQAPLPFGSKPRVVIDNVQFGKKQLEKQESVIYVSDELPSLFLLGLKVTLGREVATFLGYVLNGEDERQGVVNFTMSRSAVRSTLTELFKQLGEEDQK